MLNEREAGGRRYELTEPGSPEGGWGPPMLQVFVFPRSFIIFQLYNTAFQIKPKWPRNCDSVFPIFSSWIDSPIGPVRGSTITLKIPLEEWSAQHRDLYPTTHNTHKKQTSMLPAGFEPVIPSSERSQSIALDRIPIGIGAFPLYSKDF